MDDVPCLACGTELDPGSDRAFAVGAGAFLCYACALARGGAWDELHDRWTRAPRTSGIPSVADHSWSVPPA